MHLDDPANIQSPTSSIQSQPKEKASIAKSALSLFMSFSHFTTPHRRHLWTASIVLFVTVVSRSIGEPRKFPKLLLSFRFLFGVGKVGRHVVLSQFYDARVWHRILCLPSPSYSLHCSVAFGLVRMLSGETCCSSAFIFNPFRLWWSCELAWRSKLR